MVVAAINMGNFGTVRGRVSKEVKRFANSVGGESVSLSLAVEGVARDKDGNKIVDFLQFEDVLSKEEVGKTNKYDILHKGDLIEIVYELKNNDHTKSDGTKWYGMKAMVRGIEKLEPKSVTDARMQAKDSQAESAAEPEKPVAEKKAKGKKKADAPAPEQLPFN